jgi:hypothetical protein
MHQITEDIIEKSLSFINNANDEELNQKSEQYADKHESLVAYVFQTATEDNDEELLGYLVYYYTLILNIFENAGLSIPEISDDHIDEFHNEYLELIDDFNEEKEYPELVDWTFQLA